MHERTRNAKREERVGWARGHRLVLTDRDLRMLYAAGVMVAVRTSDLTELFFKSAAPARDRLRRLFVGGYLECHAPLVNGENYYCLTPRGRDAVLAAYENVSSGSMVCARTLPARLEHLSLTNRARVLFTIATRTPDAPCRLVAFRAERELARAYSPSLYGILPDAIATLEAAANGRIFDIAIEADTGTESPTVMASKTRRYLHYICTGQLLYGSSIHFVLVLANGVRRLRAVARAVAGVDAQAPVHFADALTLRPEGVFGGGVRALAEVPMSMSPADESR